MSNLNYVLSKSTYVRGIRCLKSLYLNKHNPGLRDKVNELTQFKFDKGKEVGILAQKLFPDGVDCGIDVTGEVGKSIVLTGENIKKGLKTIYEAAFICNEVVAIADIITKNGGEWNVYEVKSSTEIKDYHYNDAAVQYYVLKNSGLKIKDISLVFLDNTYVRTGELEIAELFKIQSVKDEVIAIQKEVEENIKNFKSVLDCKDIPDIKIGKHCKEGYECDFIGHCFGGIPGNSIFDIPRFSRNYELYNAGIIKIEDLPDDIKLSGNQKIVVDCYINKKNFIDKQRMKDFLKSITYPLYFMDFETIQTVIPEYDNSRPYQQIPFQFSLHYRGSKDSELKHFEYLAEPNCDPRPEFIKKLIEYTKNPGKILCYNANFEKNILKSLSNDFPDYRYALNIIIDRIVDLMIPFREMSYYKPQMKGSYSLKNVLPAVVPGSDYSGLEIQDGETAALTFMKLSSIKDDSQVKKIRRNLLDYCKLDTYALVKILEELQKVI